MAAAQSKDRSRIRMALISIQLSKDANAPKFTK